METETLLDALAADTLVPWKLERSIRLALTVGNIIAGTMFFGCIGFRPDIVFAMGTTGFLVKFAVTLPLALTATSAMVRVAQPGATFGIHGWALAISPTILMFAVLIEIVTVPPPLWGSKMIGTNAQNCLTLIPFLSIGPLACLLLALRKGAPTRPGLAGAIATVLAMVARCVPCYITCVAAFPDPALVKLPAR